MYLEFHSIGGGDGLGRGTVEPVSTSISNNSAVNRDHRYKSKETRVITYAPADILVGI